MAAGLMVKLNLLEEEELEAEEGEYYVQPNGELKKARPAKQIGKIKRKTRESQFLEVYRLSEDLVNELESDLSPYMRHTKRASGFTKRFKVCLHLGFFIQQVTMVRHTKLMKPKHFLCYRYYMLYHFWLMEVTKKSLATMLRDSYLSHLLLGLSTKLLMSSIIETS